MSLNYNCVHPTKLNALKFLKKVIINQEKKIV